MPQTTIRQELELPTRNQYTRINAEISLKIDGREIPNMAVLGEALDAAVVLVSEKIQQSYQTVPARV